MQARHILAAVLAAGLWGSSFVVIRIGLDNFPPLLLAALRFAVASAAALALPRPPMSWPRMIALASALFIGEFGFLFSGMAAGMPPGLASITLQTQAFFTLIIVALLSWTPPGPRQSLGAVCGLMGLGIIASTAQSAATSAGLALTLAAAASWAVGNVLLKQAGKVDMLALVAWLSIIPPLPLLLLSLAIEGQSSMQQAIAHISGAGVAAVLFLAIAATLFPFWIWGHLMKIYMPQIVAPFSLLVPVFGIVSSRLVFGERIGGAQLLGGAMILAGLSLISLNAKFASLSDLVLCLKRAER